VVSLGRPASRSGWAVSRVGLLLAVLLLLLAGTSATERSRVPVPGASVSAAPSSHDDLHNLRDQPRHAATARHTPPTALSDGWWVVWQPATGAHVPHGRSFVSENGATATVAAASSPRSSRAPPQA
jgi:hypothetical protein